MKEYQYLIVGAGMTADAAVRGIREIDPHGTIGMIGQEADPPYNRPPLSKGLWKGKSLEGVWRKTEALGVSLHLGRTAVSLDAAEHLVRDEQGEAYRGEKLLLATGGTPRRLPFGGEEVIYYRTLADYRRLREAAERHRSFVVVGGGFIGSEIAAALAMNGRQVTLLFPEDGIGASAFPHELSQYLNGYYKEKGVEVLAGEKLAGIEKRGSRFEVETESGRRLKADQVVAGIGLRPNTGLAEAAGLQVANGIVVDETLVTSRPGIYAAGDVAEFDSPELGRRLRVEHEDNANAMGRQAGRNMAGAGEPYRHLPFFYSDLFDLGYEAVGTLDSRMTTIAEWERPFQKGVIYYIQDGRVRGVLLWNVWEKVEAARKLIAAPGPFTPEIIPGLIQA